MHWRTAIECKRTKKDATLSFMRSLARCDRKKGLQVRAISCKERVARSFVFYFWSLPSFDTEELEVIDRPKEDLQNAESATETKKENTQ